MTDTPFPNPTDLEEVRQKRLAYFQNQIQENRDTANNTALSKSNKALQLFGHTDRDVGILAKTKEKRSGPIQKQNDQDYEIDSKIINNKSIEKVDIVQNISSIPIVQSISNHRAVTKAKDKSISSAPDNIKVGHDSSLQISCISRLEDSTKHEHRHLVLNEEFSSSDLLQERNKQPSNKPTKQDVENKTKSVSCTNKSVLADRLGTASFSGTCSSECEDKKCTDQLNFVNNDFKPSFSISSRFGRTELSASLDSLINAGSDPQHLQQEAFSANLKESSVDDFIGQKKSKLSNPEMTSLSLDDSSDLAVFRSFTECDELGLETHRPKGSRGFTEVSDTGLNVFRSQLPAEDLLLGTSAGDLKDLLGENKFKEFIQKTDYDISQLHVQRQPTFSSTLDKSRAYHDSTASCNSLTKTYGQFIPQVKCNSKLESAPVKSLPHQKVHEVSGNGFDRGTSVSRNYEQFVVPPHHVSYTTDEIYHQAYFDGQRNDFNKFTALGSSQNNPLPVTSTIDVLHSHRNLFSSAVCQQSQSPLSYCGTSVVAPGPIRMSSSHSSFQPPSPTCQVTYRMAPPPSLGSTSSGWGGPYPNYPAPPLVYMPLFPNPRNQNFPSTISQSVIRSQDPLVANTYPPVMFVPVIPGASPDHKSVSSSHGFYNAPHITTGEMQSNENSVNHDRFIQWGSSNHLVSLPHPVAHVGRVQVAENGSATSHADAVRHFHEQKRKSLQSIHHKHGPTIVKDFTVTSSEQDLSIPNTFSAQKSDSFIQTHSEPDFKQRIEIDGQNEYESCGKKEDDDDVDGISVVAGSSVGGITERMKDLGVDPVILSKLKQRAQDQISDEAALLALQNFVLQCPECGAFNKKYLTWCLQCSAVLIGVEPIPKKGAKSLKTRKQAEEKKTELKHVKSKPTALQQVPCISEVSHFEEIYFQTDEPSQIVKDSRNIISLDGQTAARDEMETEKKRKKEDDPAKDSVGSSESENGVASIDILDRQKYLDEQMLKVAVFTKDNQQLIKEEESCIQSQTALEKHFRSPQEIRDICEAIDDPILRGFIKSYLQKQSSNDHIMPADEKRWTDHNQSKDKNHSCINAVDLDLVKDGQASPKYKRNAMKQDGKKDINRSVDIEIFAAEEARQSHGSHLLSAGIVPPLNLKNNNDDDDELVEDRKNFASQKVRYKEKAKNHALINDKSRLSQQNASSCLSSKPNNHFLISELPKKDVQPQIVHSAPQEASTILQTSASQGSFAHAGKSKQRMFHHAHEPNPPRGPRAQSAPSAQHFASSRMAWASYNHPREFQTRSSWNFQQARPGSGKHRGSHVNGSHSHEILNSTSQIQRPRPASADYSRASQNGKSITSNPPQVSPDYQQHRRMETSEKVSSQALVSRRSPTPTRVYHRLPVRERALHPVPVDTNKARQIYDRFTEIMPGVHDGGVSKWLYLPDELWLHLLSYLPQGDLGRVLLTCKQLYRVALDESLWRYVTLKKKDGVCDEWLAQIAQRHPISLAIVQCHGDNVSSDALRELFREIASGLKELNFSRCSRGALTGDNILLLASARCRNLTYVDASWCHITDNGLSALSECCHRLESLCLNGCQMITNEGLECVLKKHGSSLRVLELFGCFSLTSIGFQCLATYCNFLLTLNMGQCYKVTDSCVVTLSASLGHVENLDLRGCKQIKDTCIRKVVRNCPRLRTLTLANCPFVSDAGIVEIATYSSNIRVLDVCGCRNITDASIRTLANNCSRLSSIDISSTSCTHKSVLVLATHSHSLECAKFNFLPDITEHCLMQLVKSCKRLNTVHLYGCTNIRDTFRLKSLNRFLHIEL